MVLLAIGCDSEHDNSIEDLNSPSGTDKPPEGDTLSVSQSEPEPTTQQPLLSRIYYNDFSTEEDGNRTRCLKA